MEAPATTPTPPDNRGAWLSWIIATIVLPTIAGGMFLSGRSEVQIAFSLLALAFIIHFASSLNMHGMKGCAVLALFLGGWALMVVSFYVGCMASAASHEL